MSAAFSYSLFTTASDIKLSWFNSLLVVALGGTGGIALSIATSSNHGSSFSSAYTASSAVVAWSLKAGPNEILALPVQSAGGSPFLARSTDGTTWTNISLSGLGSTDIPADIVNLGGSTWLMVVQTASSGCYFRKSLDGGLTWSLASTVTSRNTGFGGSGSNPVQPVLAAFGQLVICQAFTGSANTVQRVIVSSDGGVTWSQGAQSLITGSVAFAYGIAQSNGQALAYNNLQAQFSDVGGIGTLLT